MRIDRLAHIVYWLLLVSIVGVVTISWVMNALGYGWTDVLTQSGLRWAFRNLPDIIMPHWISHWLLFLLSCGACELLRQHGAFVRQHNKRQRRSLLFCSFLFCFWIVILLLLAIVPSSPLLSVVGELDHSPWVSGAFDMCCIGFIVCSSFYLRIMGTGVNMLQTLSYGLQRYAALVADGMLLSVLLSLIHYSIN